MGIGEKCDGMRVRRLGGQPHDCQATTEKWPGVFLVPRTSAADARSRRAHDWSRVGLVLASAKARYGANSSPRFRANDASFEAFFFIWLFEKLDRSITACAGSAGLSEVAATGSE